MEQSVEEPSRFGMRGQRLYDALGTTHADEPARVLAEEAARLADRLDAIDAIISGKGVLSLLRFRLVDDEGRVAEVKFDNVLGEARQQAGALRQILATLGVGKAEAAPAEEKGTALDELNARRASRSAGTSGRSRA